MLSTPARRAQARTHALTASRILRLVLAARVAGSACASQLTTVSMPGVTELTWTTQIGFRTSPTVRAVARTRWNCAWVAMVMPASTGGGTTIVDHMQRPIITIRPPRSNNRFSARATRGRVPPVVGTKSVYKFSKKPTNCFSFVSRTSLTQSASVAPYLRMHSRWVKSPYSLHGGSQVADVFEL